MGVVSPSVALDRHQERARALRVRARESEDERIAGQEARHRPRYDAPGDQP
ncbi:MAG: hypothetical protein AAF138_11540 [Planctomycetota bacterium]